MKNITTTVATALCCLSLFATSCRKSKEEARLFADRHWHRTQIKTTTCYDYTTTAPVSSNKSEVGFDTVFALQKVESGGVTGVNFLGFTLWPYEHGIDSVVDYIYSGGHGPGAFSFEISYSGKRNAVYSSHLFNSEQTITDSVQHTSCTTKSYTTWTSQE